MDSVRKIPRGVRNNNPLNLRLTTTPWVGKVSNNTDGLFEQFVSIEYGIRAAFINMSTISKRIPRCNVHDLIKVWAPPTENNTASYLKRVLQIADVTASTLVDVRKKNQTCRILWAMAIVENGEDIGFGRVENAYEMAFGKVKTRCE